MSATREKAPASAGPRQQAEEKVSAGVDQVKSNAGGLIRSQVDQRSTQLEEQLNGVVQALRQAEQSMKQEGTPGTQLVNRAAEQVERGASYLSRSDGERLLNDLEELGRRNPWGVIAGGVAAGFLAARFLKASSSRRFQEQRRTQSGGSSTTPRQLPRGEGRA